MRSYPVATQPELHVNAESKIDNLRKEVAEGYRPMNEWTKTFAIQ